ncbi:MAG: hypothetical protein DBX49_03975 [Clostridia bacterium]|nr:MAG: hypothetical protein DBX49_03975 [Clostridia bacterium]
MKEQGRLKLDKPPSKKSLPDFFDCAFRRAFWLCQNAASLKRPVFRPFDGGLSHLRRPCPRKLPRGSIAFPFANVF